MATIVTRSGKGSPLTHAEMDANFTNLNDDNLQSSDIGSSVQAYDAQLADIASLTPTDNNIIVGDGANFALETPAQARTSLGLVIGTNVQAYDANLATIAAFTPTDGQVMRWSTSSNDWTVSDIIETDSLLQDIADISGTFTADGEMLVATGAGAVAIESGDTLRTSIMGAIGPDLTTLGAVSSDGEMIVGTGAGAFAYESGETLGTSIGACIGDLVTLGAAASDGQMIVATGAGAFTYESGETLGTSIGACIGDLVTLGAASSDGEFIVATGAGAFAYESGATVRTSLDVDQAGTAVAMAIALGG